MKNYERMAMRKINGVSAETWRELVADAKRRAELRADAENWIGAPSDEGNNNN